MLRVAVSAAIALTLVAALVVSLRGDASDYVTAATVPGVGRVEGTLAAGATVRPPATVPAVAPLRGEVLAGLRDARDLARRSARPRDDWGKRYDIDPLMEALGERLYLAGALRSCFRPWRAGAAVAAYVFTAPQAEGELADLVANREALAADCRPYRLRIDEWHGVQARDREATATLSGAHERRGPEGWEAQRRRWRVVLREVGTQWKISALWAERL